MTDHTRTVHDQFDPQASAYLTSAVHASGADLQHAAALVSAAIPREKGVALDLGCGAGHLSYALAPHVSRVIAVDPSPQMLAMVRLTADERRLPIETAEGSATALPLADASVCVAASRYSAHHWLGIEAAMAEMRRVVKPGGYLLMIDVLGDEDDLVNTHLQSLELLRDRSHIRNLKASDWKALINAYGFSLSEAMEFPLPLQFTSWVERMRTPPQRVDMIRTVMAEAPQEVRDALAIQDDGSFTLHTGLFWAKAV